MVKVCVLGHSPDEFTCHEKIQHVIDDVVVVLKRQYSGQLELNTTCEPGVGHWLVQKAIEHNIKYNVYIAGPPNEQSKYWTNEQQSNFIKYLDSAASIHVEYENISPILLNKRNIKMIDNSQWILVFWNGRHQGFTYNAIEYAISSNKIVLNGLDNLKMILSENINGT